MAITISGDGITSANIADSAITSAKINDGTITNADINASAAIDGSKISGDFGKVLQVLNDTGTSIWTTSTTYQDTNAEVIITPSATTSKILLIADCPYEHYDNSGTDTGIRFGIYRGSTQLREVTNYRQFYMTSTGVSTHGETSIIYLDSPSSTSALTYKVQFRNYGSVNAQSKGPSLTAMEIGA